MSRHHIEDIKGVTNNPLVVWSRGDMFAIQPDSGAIGLFAISAGLRPQFLRLTYGGGSEHPGQLSVGAI